MMPPPDRPPLCMVDDEAPTVASVVAHLADLARTGAALDIVAAVRTRDGVMTFATPSDDCFAQLGAVTRLSHHLNSLMDHERGADGHD